MKWWLAIALLAGCSDEDLCNDPQIAGLTCISLKVNGSVDNDFVDEMQVDTAYSPSASVDATVATHRQSIRVDPSEDLGQSKLPVSFPVIFLSTSDQFTDFTARIVVVAKFEGRPVGIGQLYFGSDGISSSGITPKTHVKRTLTLAKASGSTCFDGVQSSGDNETDVDCGGRLCQACTKSCASASGLGCQCMVDSDCVTPLTCVFVTTNSIDERFCQ
jgi:hypothetical protein